MYLQETNDGHQCIWRKLSKLGCSMCCLPRPQRVVQSRNLSILLSLIFLFYSCSPTCYQVQTCFENPQLLAFKATKHTFERSCRYKWQNLTSFTEVIWQHVPPWSDDLLKTKPLPQIFFLPWELLKLDQEVKVDSTHLFILWQSLWL